MRLDRSKEWWIARARAEGDAVIGAGMLARDPLPDDRPAVAIEENRIAFGRFINLMRRQEGYSIEALADAAEVDASELLVIEDDVHYVPGPRTVRNTSSAGCADPVSSTARLMRTAGRPSQFHSNWNRVCACG